MYCQLIANAFPGESLVDQASHVAQNASNVPGVTDMSMPFNEFQLIYKVAPKQSNCCTQCEANLLTASGSHYDNEGSPSTKVFVLRWDY